LLRLSTPWRVGQPDFGFSKTVATVAGLCPVPNQPIPEIALYSGDNTLGSGRDAPAAVMVAALTLIGQRQR